MYSVATVLAWEFSPSVEILNRSAIFLVSLFGSLLLCDAFWPPKSFGCIVGLSSSSMSTARFDKFGWVSWRYFVIFLNLSPISG